MFIPELIHLLQRQSGGDTSAVDELYAACEMLDRTELKRIEDVSNLQQPVLQTIMEEWKSMFSFSPGVEAGIPVISNLLEWLEPQKRVESLDLYNTDMWTTIVRLRGPFECMIRQKCKSCGAEYVAFGQSGFDDRYPAICQKCGDVWLQSGYDESPLPDCHCGGRYLVNQCPDCESSEVDSRQYGSSYEYFLNHDWKEKDR